MNKIWAPWRSKFIYSRKRKGCVFCMARDAKNDKISYVLKRTKYSFSVLNIYPYNNGHIMISPKRHKATLGELKKPELTDMIMLLNEMTLLLEKKLNPHGFNIGMNAGKAAGAGYPGHLHIHIVPRWNGDTNFMPVLSDTKIISESLDSLYERLKSSCGK
ncbi:MAG: HIT domain-containing protein [Candidatus Omnitrophota bacterium]